VFSYLFISNAVESNGSVKVCSFVTSLTNLVKNFLSANLTVTLISDVTR